MNFSKIFLKFKFLKILILTMTLAIIFCIIFQIHLPSVSNKQSLFPNYKNNNFKVFKDTKVLCYILLAKNKIKVAKLITKTWGSHCDKLLFFGNFLTFDLPMIQINSTEGYEFLWGKSKTTLLYLQQHFSQKYEWFFKADADTFVILENLKEFISKINNTDDQALWFGFKMRHKKMTQGYMSGGAGYAFNSKALSKVSSLLKENSEGNFYQYNPINRKAIGCRSADPRGIEDLELGRCFHAAGIKDIKTTDSLGRERFLPLSLSSLMSGDISGSHWIWRQAWNNFKTGSNCCSSDLVSIHEVDPSQLRILYFLIYQLKHTPSK